MIDGRDLVPVLQGDSLFPARPRKKPSTPPCRCAHRNPPGEWAASQRHEYAEAFFYHGSQGSLAAVRWRNWKLYLNPSLQLYDLVKDPGETQLVRNGAIARKLRGMVILFQHEMRTDARPAGEVALRPDGLTEILRSTLNQLNTRRDVTYARYGDRTLEMDIYRPKGEWSALPAVVCIHGGGWAKGDRTSHAKIAQALAPRGYVAATISYRLSGEAPFPAQIYDCKAAVRFLRANSKTYGINPDQIGAIGLSAGGHLTALLATSGGVKELEGNGGHAQFSSTIRRRALGAQTDLLSDRTREISAIEARGKIWRQFLGAPCRPTQHLPPRLACIISTSRPAHLAHHRPERRSQHARHRLPPTHATARPSVRPHHQPGRPTPSRSTSVFNQMIQRTDAFKRR